MVGKIFKRMLTVSFWTALFSGSFLIVVVMLWLGWYLLGPNKPVANEARQTIANRSIAKTVEELREKRGGIRRVAVLHFENDPTDYVTLRLREVLSSSGAFDVDDTGFCEKLRNLLSLRNPGCFSTTDAMRYGKSNGLQAVVIGELEQFESRKDGAVLIGTVRMVNVATGEIIDVPLKEDTTVAVANQIKKATDFPKLRAEAELMPWYLRFLSFVAIALLLPVITISFIRHMVAKKSNGCNAFVLALYTVIDAIFAFFMVGGRFESTTDVLMFLAASGCAFLYNVCIMTFALKLES